MSPEGAEREPRARPLRRAGVIPAVITVVDVGVLAVLREGTDLPLFAADAIAVGTAAVVEHVLARDVAQSGDPHVEHVRHPGAVLGMAGAAIAADVGATVLTDAALRAVGRRNVAVAKSVGLVAGTAARFAAQRSLMGRRFRRDSVALRERHPAPGELRLSVVVPAYREAARIGASVAAIRAAIADAAAHGGAEIIVVDDGSADGTASAARTAGADVVVEAPVNRGKGASVRSGVERARGRTIVFIDADLSYAPDQILRMLAAIEMGHDVAVGNRRLRGSRHAGTLGPVRAIASRSFNLVTRALLIGGYADTQSGLKAFRSDAARRIFTRARIDRFAFDVEILHLVERYHLSLVEVPVTVTESETSTVRLLPDALRVVRDVLRIRDWAGRGLYDEADVDEPAAAPAGNPPEGRGSRVRPFRSGTGGISTMAVTESTDTLSVQAAARPDALAVVVDGAGGARPSSTTFAELEALANRLAHGWRALGIEAGERLVWCGPNSLEVIATIHGARKAALVSVPLSYRFIGDEMQYVVDNAEAAVVMIDAEQAPTLAEVMDRLPTVREVVVFGGAVPAGSGFRTWDELIAGQPTDEVDAPAANSLGATMVYTSGTTGKPKGAMRTSSDKAIVGAMMQRLGLLEGEHRHLTTGPLYHSGPLSFAALNHSIGAPIYVLRKFDAVEWLRIVREHRITNTFTAPTQLKRLVSLPPDELAKADLSSMRCLIANAAPVPYALKQEFIATFGDGFLFEVYGSTELGVATILGPEDQLRKPGSCGQTYGGVQVRIVKDDGTDAAPGEPGELFISTGLGMDGYHHTEEILTELAGTEWKSVGDVAYVDDEGFVHICDRKKDMIISGGVNIYPAEIEAVIYGHPQILDAAVFGIPDDEWGERVHAIVQAKAGETVDLEDLRAFVDARLAGYMRPRAYETRDELPRTDAGKLLKRVLRDEYWQGRASAV